MNTASNSPVSAALNAKVHKHTPLRTGNGTFGRHGSFPLRFGWIPKGLEELRENPTVFKHEDATVCFGVGKNMVTSMQYWLEATRLVNPSNSDQGLEWSSIAEIVFNEAADPYLEDDGTIWLLHWLLASNPRSATAIYWFFNHFHKPTFTSDEVATGLRDFVHREISSKTSQNTLKRDSALVLRMYAHSHKNDGLNLEESLDSPLATLRLLQRLDVRLWRSDVTKGPEIPLFVLAFAIAEVFQSTDRQQLPIHDLMYSNSDHCAPGAVFRMTEEGLVNQLEAVCRRHHQQLALDQTAGIFQLYKRDTLDPLMLLRDHYEFNAERAEA
ncbi:MAG: DUF4007 family protein [Gammaproteobacteria bacterium]|nr:DUF4007 family protein [Gammaproteobacteria bacterium]